MTYTVMRTPLTKGKNRSVKQKHIDIEKDISLEAAGAWILAHLGDSAWIYCQDNEKEFNGKDAR